MEVCYALQRPVAVEIGLLQIFQNNHWDRRLPIWRINSFFPKPELVVPLSSINLFSPPHSLHSKLFRLGAQHSFGESASRTPTLLKLVPRDGHQSTEAAMLTRGTLPEPGDDYCRSGNPFGPRRADDLAFQLERSRIIVAPHLTFGEPTGLSVR